jgi:hypothetical protein
MRIRLYSITSIFPQLLFLQRCHFLGRVAARLYDGLRHLHTFGYWSSDGMTWEEVKLKYTMEAKRILHQNTTEEDIAIYVHKRILEKTCCTNALFNEHFKTKSKFQFQIIIKLLFEIFRQYQVQISRTTGKSLVLFLMNSFHQQLKSWKDSWDRIIPLQWLEQLQSLIHQEQEQREDTVTITRKKWLPSFRIPRHRNDFLSSYQYASI